MNVHSGLFVAYGTKEKKGCGQEQAEQGKFRRLGLAAEGVEVILQ